MNTDTPNSIKRYINNYNQDLANIVSLIYTNFQKIPYHEPAKLIAYKTFCVKTVYSQSSIVKAKLGVENIYNDPSEFDNYKIFECIWRYHTIYSNKGKMTSSNF
jgi:hypothetical protein